MGTSSTKIELVIEDEHLAGTFLAPESKVPGVLFVHGWGGSQERDLDRARGIAGMKKARPDNRQSPGRKTFTISSAPTTSWPSIPR
jgi:fermentation-respiration switch protein FrsA (DUF1100 family)